MRYDLIFMTYNLVLASGSLQRSKLLRKLVPDFEVRPAQIVEIIDPKSSATQNAERLATQKARAVFRTGESVLGCDTLGEISGVVFGKPRDSAAAIARLQKLSGRTHTIVSGFCWKTDEKEIVGAASARVTFRRLTLAEIQKYVAANPVETFAGGYALQNPNFDFATKIVGERETVIGLPVESIRRLLTAA